jgi:hypothetical protein
VQQSRIWVYLSDDQKKDHPLYNKKTAFFFFCIYLYIQFILASFLLVMTLVNSKEMIFLSNILPVGVLLWFLIILGKNKKSKKTVNSFIIYIFIFPIFYIISKLIIAFSTVYITFGQAVTDSISVVTLHAVVGIVFLIYYFSSKAFNLQYLNRVK